MAIFLGITTNNTLSVLDYCKNIKRSFPRAKQKSIIEKYQCKARLSRNVDILVRFFEFLFQDLWKAGDKRFNCVEHLLLNKNSLNGVKSSLLGVLGDYIRKGEAIQFYTKQDVLAKSFSRNS